MSVIVDRNDIVKYVLHMSFWLATQRYGLTPAPGGLALVQEFINTRAIAGQGADLLNDGGAATAWAAQALPAWLALRGIDAPRWKLTDGDATTLRALRLTLTGLLTSGTLNCGTDGTTASAQLLVAQDGQVQLLPSGRGPRWLSSALWTEVLQAQLTGNWTRLKVCRNSDCSSAFYDRSKNHSGVWHNVKTCGNAANLRTSRARRRTAAAQ
jgi:predicted RNA-binding Zn ribbon-like protein